MNKIKELKHLLADWDIIVLLASLIAIVILLSSRQSIELILITLVTLWVVLGLVEAMIYIYKKIRKYL